MNKVIACMFFVWCIPFTLRGAMSAQDNWDGDKYYESSEPQFYGALEALQAVYGNDLAVGLEQFSNVLDVGCGVGRLTAYIAQLPNKRCVKGVDSSQSQINFASHKYSGISNLSFICQTAEDMHVPYAYDLVLSTVALHWMSDHEKVIASMMRHLVPGGDVFILASRHVENEDDYSLASVVRTVGKNNSAFNFLSTIDLQKMYHPVKPQELKQISARYGLQSIQCYEFVKTVSFDSEAEFRKFVQGWVKAINFPQGAISDDILIDLIIVEYIKKHRKADGSIDYAIPGVIFHGKKSFMLKT